MNPATRYYRSLWEWAYKRWGAPQQEDIPTRVFELLGRIQDTTPELWYMLSGMIADTFKVEVEVVPLDSVWFSTWFNTTVYPIINSHGGRFTLDEVRYFTCSIEDLRRIIRRDFTNFRAYSLETFNCQDYTLLLRAKLIWHYGINSFAQVVSVDYGHEFDPDPAKFNSHEFGVFAAADNRLYGIEPQNDRDWPIENPLWSGLGTAPFYKLGNTYSWIM